MKEVENRSASRVPVYELHEIAELIAGQSPESSTYNYDGKGLPFFQGKADFQERYPIVRVWCSSEKRKEAIPGDILMSVRAPVGSVNLCDQLSVIGRGLSAIRPRKQVPRDYLFFYFKANEKQIDALGTGSTFKAITQDTLKKIKIPLPPLQDQIRIAHLLEKVEGLIAKRKEDLAQLDLFLKSVFLEMFGDPAENQNGFPIRKLDSLYTNPKEGTKCGPFGSALKKEEFVEQGVPVWNMDNISHTGQMVSPFRMWISEEKFADLKAYSVIDGDVVISRAGTVGKMCVAKMNGQHGIISTNLIRVRFGSDLLPLYFVSLMNYCKGKVGRLKTGPDGAFTHMNTGILDSLEFPLPPLTLQNQFAAIVEKVEGLKSQYQQGLTGLEALYASLSQKAFAGELDLERVKV